MKKLLPILLRSLIRALGITYRFKVYGIKTYFNTHKKDSQNLVAFLHGRQACLTYFFSRPDRLPFGILSSKSRDGDMQKNIMEGLGVKVLRGSSGKTGAKAIIDIIKHLRENKGVPIALAMDGSKGPRGDLKPGMLIMSQKTNSSIIPVAASANKAWEITRNWDQMCIPKPFSKITILVGSPINIPKRTSPEEFEGQRQFIEDKIIKLQEKCDKIAGFNPSKPVKSKI